MSNERSKILELLTEEKEAYSAYAKLCERYKASPDRTIAAVASSRVSLLEQLLKETKA